MLENRFKYVKLDYDEQTNQNGSEGEKSMINYFHIFLFRSISKITLETPSNTIPEASSDLFC